MRPGRYKVHAFALLLPLATILQWIGEASCVNAQSPIAGDDGYLSTKDTGEGRLGAVDQYRMPIKQPSASLTPVLLTLDNQSYRIPRNLIVSVEYLGSGAVGAIALNVLLPNMTGFSEAEAQCFLDPASACHAQIVSIALTHGKNANSGVKQIENIRSISHSNEQVGQCGLKYYEGLGSDKNGGVVFRYFFQTNKYDADKSVARCPTEASAFAPRCNSAVNLSDGNSISYNFGRSNLCSWGEIRRKTIQLITSIREGGTQ